MLVLLTGPVGGGKTTTALALRDELRRRGHRPAVVDVDLLYLMADDGQPAFSSAETWRIAYRSAAALADLFFDSGLSVVIVEAGFFTEEERAWLCDHLRSDALRKYVTLDLSFEETLRRVTADPSDDRVATRNPAVLRWHYDRFVEARAFLSETTAIFDAEHLTPPELAVRIRAALVSSR